MANNNRYIEFSNTELSKQYTFINGRRNSKKKSKLKLGGIKK